MSKLTTASVMTIDRPTWTCRTNLLPYQEEAIAKLLPSRVGALFMEMGTGKTRTAIEFVRIRQRKIDRVVWFCPVSLKETIRAEILKHTTCPESDIYVFDDRTNERTMPQGAFWYIVGIESMSSSARVILTVNQLVTDRTFAIVDESTYIKGHRAWRTQRITVICQRARYRMILTGTPMTQGCVDLFAQMKFLSPKILGYSGFYSFARNHLEYSDRFPGLIVRTHNTKYLAAKIHPYVYQITKDEADLHLPDKVTESYYVPMTTEQLEAYEKAKDEILSLDEDEWFQGFDDWWESVRIFRLFSTLQGIVIGRWRRKDGTVQELPHHRAEVLLEVVREIPPSEKVVVWAKYRYALVQIVEALAREYGENEVMPLHGTMNARKRHEALTRWRESARFLVATQGVGGHGLDMTVARYMVFYANGFKYSERLQAEDRIHRIGQTRKPVYIDIFTSTGIESRIQEALADKSDTLHKFRQEVDRVKKDGTKERVRQLIKSL